jgi:hypothetical protein
MFYVLPDQIVEIAINEVYCSLSLLDQGVIGG